jgi:hypothetical protein
MGTHRSSFLAVSLLALAASFAPSALADGMVFRTAVVEGDVQHVEVGLQRGLVWRRFDTDALEVWIEPVYAWEGDDEGAWVIPLPALPQVLEGDPKVLDDLDALTAPTFLSFCWEPNCNNDCTLAGCPLMGASKSGGTEGGGRPVELDGSEAAVTVWASGTVGLLDYEVLSATGGQGAVAWLAAHGYAVGEGAAEALAALDTEGLFFFVARVAAPQEAGQSLAPVRFVFAPDVLPFYPVRLTAAALPAETHLDVTLWLLSDVRLLPATDEAVLGSLDVSNRDAAGYEASIEGKLSGLDEGGFVVEYAAALTEARPNGIGEGQVRPVDCGDGDNAAHPAYCPDAWGATFCDFEGCAPLEPVALTSDLKQRVRDAETPYAVRLRGRLPAGSRDTEWTFAGATGYESYELDRLTAVYADSRGDCYECPTAPPAGLFCAPTGTRPDAPGPVLLALFATLAALAGLRTWKKARVRRAPGR